MSGPNYTIHDIARHVENVNRAVRGGEEPKSAFLKYAAEHSMPPGLLKAAVHNWNKIRAINFMSKAANRGDAFTVLNADEVTNEYAKSAMTAPTPEASDYASWSGIQRIPTRKVAAVVPLEGDDHVQVVEKAPALPAEKLACSWHQELADEFRLKAAHASVNGSIDIVLRDMEKLAQTAAELMYARPDRLRIIEEALWAEDGVRKYATVFDWVEDLCKASRTPCERAKKACKRRILDTELFEKLSTMHELDRTLEELVGAQTDLNFSLEKLAAVGTAPAGTASGVKHKSQQPPEPKVPYLTAPKDEDIGGLSLPTVPAAPASGLGMLSAMAERAGIPPSSNTRQRAVDELLGAHRSSANLTRLMLTDPVISEADPEDVATAYEAILMHSPSLAADHHALRAALREGLQYGSMPLSTAKELAALEKTKGDIQRNESEISGNRYRLRA